MAVKLVTARGQPIILNPSFRVEGVPIERDAPSVEMTYRDGAVGDPNAVRTLPRQITVSGHFSANSEPECDAQRQAVIQALAAGPVRLYKDALDERYITAVFLGDSHQYVQGTARTTARVSFRFRANDPAWRSVETSVQLTADGTVINRGTAPVSPVITISGPISNPSIANVTTGQTLGLTLALTDGQAVVVDCERFTAKRAGVSVLSSLNDAFLTGGFRLEPGANQITIGGSGTKNVLFAWTPRFY